MLKLISSSLFLASLFFQNFASAAKDLGKEIIIKTNPADQKLQFGVHYAYDSGAVAEKFTIQWRILFSANINQQELETLPRYLYWNIFDSQKNELLWNWSPDQQFNRNDLVLASFSVTGEPAKKAIATQSHTFLVIGNQKGQILYNLNIGNLCLTHPTYFSNLTEFQKSCSQISENDIDHAKANYCESVAGELLTMIDENVYTCQEAQQIYTKRGCENLMCN